MGVSVWHFDVLDDSCVHDGEVHSVFKWLLAGLFAMLVL